jgi:hypothetical protein
MSKPNRFLGAVRRVRWLLWGSLLCTLVATAHAEYTLAVATGMHFLVAGAVPGALDLYVVASLRQAREVLPAVLLSVAANVVSHLVAAQVLPMHWGIISAVGAVAPVLLWRVHFLWKSAPAPLPDESAKESTAPEGAPGVLRVGIDPSRMEGLTHYIDQGREHLGSTWPWSEEQPPPVLLPEAPLYAPEAWFEETEPGAVSAPAPEALPAPEDLLPEGALDPSALGPGDSDHVGSLLAYLADCQENDRMPSARGCKEFCNVGWPRAKRLMAYAGFPEKDKEEGA